MLLTLLACHLFLHLTKLLAALFQPECAGSLSCSNHVSIGTGPLRTMWREALGVDSGQTGNRWVGMEVGPKRSNCAGEWSTVDRCFVYIKLFLPIKVMGECRYERWSEH